MEGAIRELVEPGIQAVEEGIRAVEAATLEVIQEEATQAVLAGMAVGTPTTTMEEAAATATIITLSQEEDHHQTKTPS